MRPVSRVFLQAWILVFMERDKSALGGPSTFLLTQSILNAHKLAYPDIPLRWKEVERFIESERKSKTGVLRGSGKDNLLRWDNVDPMIVDVKNALLKKMKSQEDSVLKMLGVQ